MISMSYEHNIEMENNNLKTILFLENKYNVVSHFFKNPDKTVNTRINKIFLIVMKKIKIKFYFNEILP